MYCQNCQHPVHVPDDRTGVIHINGKYMCDKNSTKVATPFDVREERSATPIPSEEVRP